MNPNDKGNGIKVTDRRMFTANGDLREPDSDSSTDSVPAEAPSSAAASEAREPKGVRESRPDGGALPKPGFGDLVSVLAEPIALFLGDVPLPDGNSAENLELARFHIDLLDVLKDRTEKSLSQEELALLNDLLYQLRMRYVQKSR